MSKTFALLHSPSFFLLETIIGKLTIQDNTDTISGLGKESSRALEEKNWEVWKLAAREAKWECKEILETKGGLSRDIRKDLPRGRDRMSVSPQILQQRISIKNDRWKGTFTYYRLESYD